MLDGTIVDVFVIVDTMVEVEIIIGDDKVLPIVVEETALVEIAVGTSKVTVGIIEVPKLVEELIIIEEKIVED